MKRAVIFALPLAISVAAWTSTATAANGSVTNFPQLISGNGTEKACKIGAAQRCINHVWGVVDRNSDDLLSVEEIDDFAAHARRWNANTDRKLVDQTTVRIALLTFNLVGAKRVVDSYDQDNDGMLSMAEATIDLVNLETDKRPIAAMLLDDGAMDHDALADRFGIMASHLVNLAQKVGSSLVGGDVSGTEEIVESARADQQVTQAN